MSKREGSDTGPEPKRARTNETVEVPDELLRGILRRTNLHDDEWDDVLKWLPKESVDKLLPQLESEHYLRRLFEREEREKVINELNSLGPTRLILNEDASELTLTLPESFQNIFEEPLQQNVTLRRSTHRRQSTSPYADEPIVSKDYYRFPPYYYPDTVKEVFYFMKINPRLSERFKKLSKYAQEFLGNRREEPRIEVSDSGATFKFQSSLGLKITNYIEEGMEEYNNCLIVYFDFFKFTTIPLQETAVADVRKIMTQFSTLEGMYGHEFIELQKQRRDYFTSWDLFPGDFDQPWRIEFAKGLQSIFAIDGIFGAFSGASLVLAYGQYFNISDNLNLFDTIAQDLPRNLTVDVQRVKKIRREMRNGIESIMSKIEFRLDKIDWSRDFTHMLRIGVFNDNLLTIYLASGDGDSSERLNVVRMELEIKMKKVLSSWWQYAKDDPEEVVNAAASRRQDLLGM